MNVAGICREAFAKRIEGRINQHTQSMFLAISVHAEDVELHYARRINRLRSFLFQLQ